MDHPTLLLGLALCGCGAPAPCPQSAGALELRQLWLGGPALNEAMVVTLPSGGHLLIDVGNDSRYPEVRDAQPGPTEWVLITHEHEDHMGGLERLVDHWEISGEDPTFIEGTGLWDLGDGVTLELVKHRCTVATDDGALDLCADHPEWAEHENAMSTVGVLRYGDFDYLFAGDLPGGGGGDPDVESALVELGVVRSADVAHLSHHGKKTSTNQAWVDAVFPDDGLARNALVSASTAYLSAPHQDVLDRAGPRLAGGSVWVTDDGLTAGEHDTMRTLEADVVISVAEGGAAYSLCGEEFDSIP